MLVFSREPTAIGEEASGHRQRSPPVVVASGHRQRSSPVVVASGHRQRSSPAVVASGHRQRSSPVVIASGHRQWSSPVVIASGHRQQQSRVAITSRNHEQQSPAVINSYNQQLQSTANLLPDDRPAGSIPVAVVVAMIPPVSPVIPPQSTPPQSTVLGLPIHLLDDYPGWAIAWLRHHRHVCAPETGVIEDGTATACPAIAPPPVPQRGFHIVTLNAEMAMQAERNPRLAATIRQADLVIPDGSGVVLYLKLRRKSVQRCPGIELAEALLDYAGRTGETTGGTTGANSAGVNSAGASLTGLPGDRPLRVWFYGGKPEAIDRAADYWRSRCPGIQFAGVTHGYLNAEEQERLLVELEREQPDLILLGLGVPRQEFWIAAHRDRCPQSVWIGVGGSFDIWSGSKARAPEWFCQHHLEWLYRLYQEPWRWRRMLDLPRFAGRAMLAWVRGQ